jgi:hypothetical protein
MHWEEDPPILDGDGIYPSERGDLCLIRGPVCPGDFEDAPVHQDDIEREPVFGVGPRGLARQAAALVQAEYEGR